LDGAVRLQIQKAINNGLISRMNGAVKEGKEAIVYHADGPKDVCNGDNADDVAIKIFKRIQEFRKRGEYVDGDPRYFRKNFNSYDKREQVELWAEKEFRNLTRAYVAGVPCPQPLLQKQNILFMKFLGEDGWPCPQIREVEMKHGSMKWAHLYSQTMVATRKLYHCARLVHSDLSEYNILLCPSLMLRHDKDQSKGKDNPVDNGELQVVLIDFGQAVHVHYPSAGIFLDRDLSRISCFFAGHGIAVLNAEDARSFVLSPCEYATADLDANVSDDERIPSKHEDEDVSSPRAAVAEEGIDGIATTATEELKKVSLLVERWDEVKEYQKLQLLLDT